MITIDDDMDAVRKAKVPRSNSICACGHSEFRHQELPRADICGGAKWTCACRKMKLVLDAEDARVFMYSAASKVHPLIAGMISLKTRGKSWAWKPGSGVCEYVPPGMGTCGKPMKTAVFSIDKTQTQLRCEEHAE